MNADPKYSLKASYDCVYHDFRDGDDYKIVDAWLKEV